MRVCDITKNDEVVTRYVIVEIQNDTGQVINADEFGADFRLVHDLEVGQRAAAALEGKDWKALHNMTPYSDRPASADRSAAAKRAAATRKANKEKASRPSTDAPAGSAGNGGGNGTGALGDPLAATQGS